MIDWRHHKKSTLLTLSSYLQVVKDYHGTPEYISLHWLNIIGCSDFHKYRVLFLSYFIKCEVLTFRYSFDNPLIEYHRLLLIQPSRHVTCTNDDGHRWYAPNVRRWNGIPHHWNFPTEMWIEMHKGQVNLTNVKFTRPRLRFRIFLKNYDNIYGKIMQDIDRALNKFHDLMYVYMCRKSRLHEKYIDYRKSYRKWYKYYLVYLSKF